MILFYISAEMKKTPLFKKCLLGAVIITAVEFIFGIIFNILSGTMKMFPSTYLGRYACRIQFYGLVFALSCSNGLSKTNSF